MEIERKFLVNKKDIPVDLNTLICFNITQAYLNPSDEYLIRIRSSKLNVHTLLSNINKPTLYKLEIKNRGLLVRDEFCAEISKDTFIEMYSKCKKILSKIRYIYTENGRVYEIDEYDTLDKLIVEVEFKSEEDAKTFTPPAWIGKEVTYDINYKNVNLAV